MNTSISSARGTALCLVIYDISNDKVRKKTAPDPEMDRIEKEFAESLGTRVSIERKQVGGKLVIDFFSSDDLRALLDKVHLAEQLKAVRNMREEEAKTAEQMVAIEDSTPIALSATHDAPKEILGQVIDMHADPLSEGMSHEEFMQTFAQDDILAVPYDDRPKTEQQADGENDELYSVSSFSI